MLDRNTIRWRVLGGVLFTLATLTCPLSAGASGAWHPVVEHQSALVALDAQGRGALTFSLRTGGTNGDHAAADISLYPKVHTRLALEPIIDGQGSVSLPVSSTGSFLLDCVNNGLATFTVSVSQSADSGARRCGDHSRPALHVACHGSTCDGVYPLALTTTNGHATSTVWTLVTITTDDTSSPINLALVLTSNPVDATAEHQEASALHAVANAADVGLTVAVDYRGVSHDFFDTGTDAVDYRNALVAALSTTSHELANATPPSIDFASLGAHHLAGDVVNQARLATNLVGRFVSRAPGQSLLLSGAVSPGDLTALAAQHIFHVVVPDRSLRQAPSATLQWGTPFHVDGAPAREIAVASDAPLRLLAEDTSIAPGLRCALVLNELSLLHFQAPFAAQTRSVIVEPSLSRVGSSFLRDLLNGLRHDPLVTTSGLGAVFKSSLIGANGYPTLRVLSVTSTPRWSLDNIQATARVDSQLLSYSQSISSLVPTTPLRVRVLTAQRRQPAGTRQRVLDDVRGSLLAEFRSVHIDDTTITLAGNGTSLPITLTSSAPYTITGFLSLTAPNVVFPEGHVIPITLGASTESVRIPANISGSGNFTLVVRLLTSDRRVTIAGNAIQVRSSSTSAVGFALTGGALAVIALWWWRTSRRHGKARHAK